MSRLPVVGDPPTDRLGRPLVDLRVSVTDRCNFRCPYCMPREVFGIDHPFLPRSEILSYEEIARIVRLARGLGVRKVRLTGGEPLLRRDLPELVAMLAREPGLDLALTTNGALLARDAAALVRAGLARVTVSLDALDGEVFRAMSDTAVPVATVLAGIDAARVAGLAPIKVNCVVRRGVNDHEVASLARHFRGSGVVLRFIEYMDVGTTNHWRREEVVAAAEILDRLREVTALESLEPNYRGEVARRWRFVDGSLEIGIVASVTAPFCGDCTRARLSAEGKLYTCLFAGDGSDLRGPIRAGADDDELSALLRVIWERRSDRYSEQRAELAGRVARKVEMSAIGG